MINNIFLILFLFITPILSTQAEVTFDYSEVAQLPILSNGRIKPLDTFARSTLKRFHNKDTLKNQEAIHWFIEVLFSPDVANHKRIFRIVNPETLKTLSVTQDASNNYSAIELINCFQNNSQLIEELSKTETHLQTETQKQILELYTNVQFYIGLSRSFSLLFKDFLLPSFELSKKLHLPFRENISYIEIMNQEINLKNALAEMIKRGGLKNPQKIDQQLLEVVNYIDYIRQDNQSESLKIFPPETLQDSEWVSAWNTQAIKQMSPKRNALLSKWSELIIAYRNKVPSHFQTLSRDLKQLTLQAPPNDVHLKTLKLEYVFNRLNLFTNAAIFYISGFILFFASFLIWKRLNEFLSLASLGLGAVLHLVGISLRCIIMSRPPVSSLYESILFVGFITVLFSLIIEWRHRNGNGLFIGTTLGTILLFVSFGYEKDGDSMGMLVAVLDTNFWLATHVVTISIGYGCSLVAALLGHLYLFKKMLKIKTQEASLLSNIHGTALFSLFFTVLGTILGGIWADQSWGRFWGWDPKENGALFLCLWLLLIVHGKLAGYFKKSSFALVTSLTSIIVILAWFGVNLLNIGLHSYGFTDSIAQNIIIFALAEVLILGFFLIGANVRLRQNKDLH